MWKSIAKGVSLILNPYFIPVHITSVILCADVVFRSFPFRVSSYIWGAMALYSFVLPLITILVISRCKHSRYDIFKRHMRTTMLAVSSLCFLLGVITFMNKPTLGIFFEIASTGLCCSLLMLLLARWRHISPYMVAAGSAITFLTMLCIIGRTPVFTALLIAIFLTGVLGSGRLYLGRESLKGEAVSFALGILGCCISLFV